MSAAASWCRNCGAVQPSGGGLYTGLTSTQAITDILADRGLSTREDILARLKDGGLDQESEVVADDLHRMVESGLVLYLEQARGYMLDPTDIDPATAPLVGLARIRGIAHC